jgi:arsenate reductase-like glutaredoxin family protein
VREFLSQRNIEYTEFDVTRDEAAHAELVRMGYHATPVVVAGKEVVPGFEPAILERLLSEASRT